MNYSFKMIMFSLLIQIKLLIIGGSRGAPGTPPRESKFFHFHAVLGKNLKNISNFGSWRTPLGKILDPPLLIMKNNWRTKLGDRNAHLPPPPSRSKIVHFHAIFANILPSNRFLPQIQGLLPIREILNPSLTTK